MNSKENETIIKCNEYRKYIKDHMANVSLAWTNLQEKLTGESWLDDFTWYTIDANVKAHDESKFSNEEFHGYRQWFYPIDVYMKDETIFQTSWIYHKNRNPHHWEFWLLPEGPTKMPFIYIFEMLCDWTAMSYKFNDCPIQFYEKNKGRMILHDDTIETIENWKTLFENMALKNNIL